MNGFVKSKIAQAKDIVTSRENLTPVLRWWWSMDRVSLYAIGALVLIGMVLTSAAGPAAAARLNIENPQHFVERQLLFLAPCLAVLVAISCLTPVQAKRFGILVFAGALFLMLVTLLFGPEINGAKRWLPLGGFSLQPSEFAKPGFVIAAAWLLAEGKQDKNFPGGPITLGLYFLLAFLLLMQPDYGQWALMTAVWAVMFFIAGWSWLWIAALGALAMFALWMGYLYAPHVAKRIDLFLNPEMGDTYQVDKATEAIAGGGAFGHDFAGRGDGVKHQLPDAHTDFIFAVAGEEFGFFLCALILAIFALLVVRSFVLASGQRSVFIQCAVCGLAAQIGFQAIVNIGVSLRVLPAKGMTLPFISYGGSSLLATGLTVGLILALTRKRPTAWKRSEVLP